MSEPKLYLLVVAYGAVEEPVGPYVSDALRLKAAAKIWKDSRARATRKSVEVVSRLDIAADGTPTTNIILSDELPKVE